jgi:hypothetical protein
MGWSNGGRVQRFFWEKASCFDANDGNTFGCRYPLRDTVVGTLFFVKAPVKTIDLGLTLLGRRHGGLFPSVFVWSRRWQAFVLYIFVLSLICCVRGSLSHCIGSIVSVRRGRGAS